MFLDSDRLDDLLHLRILIWVQLSGIGLAESSVDHVTSLSRGRNGGSGLGTPSPA